MNKNEINYDKLVRDKIPEIIKNSNKKYEVHIADDAEYRSKLYCKLQEEVNEFLESPNSEEIADILEVIDAIISLNKYNDLEEIREKKNVERGTFDKRIILEKVWND